MMGKDKKKIDNVVNQRRWCHPKRQGQNRILEDNNLLCQFSSYLIVMTVPFTEDKHKFLFVICFKDAYILDLEAKKYVVEERHG